MSKKLKVAILGMGNMGRGHAGSILRMKDTLWAALCSYPVADAQNFVKEKELDCAVFDDFDQMLAETKIDVLYICLPPFAHNGQFEKAARKGIHIFIEKPIALTMERGQSMTEAAKENGICTQVGYQMRFGGAVRKFREYMEDKTAGRPSLFTASYECNSLHGPWWRDVKRCGGQVFEQVIHLYDMSLYMMGEPAAVNGYVANVSHQNVDGYSIEDTSVSNIRFESGALASITGSNCAVRNQWNGRFRIVCENMVADFEDQNHATFTFTNEEELKVERVAEDVDCTYEEDCYFIETIRGSKKPVADIGVGYQGLKLVSAVVSSSQRDGSTIVI